MAEKIDPEQTVTFEELLLSNTFEQAALVEVLARKGIITNINRKRREIKATQ